MTGKTGRTPTLATSRRRLFIAVFLTLGTTSALVVAGAGSRGASADRAAAVQTRPNVVVVESDDQTVESMRIMDRVNSLIGDHGATFKNNFVNFSLCCPSRATFLTGQYAHNHQVVDNAPPDGGFPKFEPLHGNNNLAVWLQNAGYNTAMIGKYLSYMKASTVPPGWSDWHAVVQGSEKVYGYTTNDNGILTKHGQKPTDFLDDVLTTKAVNYINRSAPKPNPFFLWLTYTAPHVSGPDPNPNPPYNCDGAAKPAPRNANAFDTEPLPKPPNFNEADVSDKPAAIRNQPLMSPYQVSNTERHYRCALESLLAVDKGVQTVVDALSAKNQLANTLIVFTSDNGFLNGEHRLFFVKRHIYEESIRVPLEMRGPGIPPGVTVGDLSINADLAPTILDVTGASAGDVRDGRSLIPLAQLPGSASGRELLIEEPTFEAIRTARYMYAEHNTGEKELYDLQKDPFELQSRQNSSAYNSVQAQLASDLHQLESCAGASCRTPLNMTLSLQRSATYKGADRCAGDPIRAKVEGRDVGGVVRAEFYVGSQRVAVDNHAPFTHKLAYRHFDRPGRTRVRVRATTLEGRRMTVDRRVRACR
jgi:N-acetylglucosamine-6-sulfatase